MALNLHTTTAVHRPPFGRHSTDRVLAVKETILRLLRVAPEHSATDETPLATLAGDPLRLAELAFHLQTELRVSVAHSDLATATVGELARLVAARADRSAA